MFRSHVITKEFSESHRLLLESVTAHNRFFLFTVIYLINFLDLIKSKQNLDEERYVTAPSNFTALI